MHDPGSSFNPFQLRRQPHSARPARRQYRDAMRRRQGGAGGGTAISPLVGEMAGRPEGGAAERDLAYSKDCTVQVSPKAKRP